jgi:CHAT domain-containing protein/tetratricopeptide (TPR) repeat protein
VVIFWPKRNKIDPAPTPVAIDEFRINHYRGKEAKPLGDIRSSEAVKRGDDVRVFANLNRPAYCYLIAFNPDGSEQLCYPAFDGSDPQSARAVVPPETAEIRFFPDDKGYFNLDTSGLQVFVLLVSSKPLPTYAEWRAAVNSVPWRAVWHGGDERWQFDGQGFSRLAEERGSYQVRDAVPPPLRELCEFFKAQAGVDAVRAVAFPVAADDRAGRLKGLELELARQERFEEAKEPVCELIALYTQEKGKEAWQTAEMRRELDAIERVASRSAEDRAEYVRGLKQLDAATALYKQGRYPEAVPLAKVGLDVIGKYLGPDDFITASVAVTYATLLRMSAKYKDAENVYRKALADTRRVVGDDHPYAASIRVGLALALDEQDKPDEVPKLLEEATAVCKRIRGPDSADEAIVLNNMAGHCERYGNFRDAETYYRQSLDILTRASGPEASTTLVTRANLGHALSEQGKYREGETLYREVLRSRLATLPEDHPDIALVRNNLAANLEEQGRYAEAEDLYRTGYDVRRLKFGDDNPLTAMSASNLGHNLQCQTRYEAAEPYFVDAIRVFEHAGYGRSRQVAITHNNLAANYRHRGRYADATKHVEMALSILRERLGDTHPSVAECFNNLAATLADQKKYAEADTVIRESLAILEQKLGHDHPLTTTARINLANNLHNQGKYAEAGPILREGLDAHRRLLGEGNPKTAWAYKNVVMNRWATGDYAVAADLGPDASASFESARQRYSFGGLDRVNATDELSPLRHLAASAARTGRPREAWTYLEGGLARGLLDDLAGRPRSDADRAREQSLVGDIDKLNDKIAALLGQARLWWPTWTALVARAEVEKLRRERDAVQGRLVKVQTDVADKHGAAAGKVYDLADIQKALRPDAALVAWLDIDGAPTFKDPAGDHWVCVVRQTGEPIWERLPGSGPKDAWTDADDELPGKVRGLLATRADAAKGQWKGAAAKLYRQRLAPAEAVLGARDGLPPVRHLIVLAPSRMAGVPVEALVPDRLTVSYAPSGSTFAWLSAGPARTESVASRSFLGVANPDFGPALPDLKATLTEVQSLTRLFTRLEVLTGSDAKESTLDKMAADGRLRQFRYLHFATHGQLDDGRPLASALVLAQEPATDGRLTAERVLHTWKLDADLVTLSACETALGKYSRGEGFLGFSQALFLAGARGTLLSLWPVDDRATTLLMTRFYENMLGTPDKVVKAMPTKADALAEAKRWLRDLSAEEVDRLTVDMPRGLPTGTRGVRREAGGTRGPDAPRPFAHPYFWSGFVLIGDAR